MARLSLLTVYEHAASDALYFHTPRLEAIAPARKQRLLGTVIGMAHFATMLSHDAAPTVKSVHSAKQRMLWIQPEADYFIHATIDLPLIRKSSSPKTATNSPLQDDSLLASLSQAYAQYYLAYGKMSDTQEKLGRAKLAEQLDRFWSEWVTNWQLENSELGQKPFQRILGGLTRSPVDASQVKPLLDQFAASNPSSLPLLLHRNTILHLPSFKSSTSTNSRSTPSLSESDVEAIVEYLATLSLGRVVNTAPATTNSTVAPSSPVKRSASPSKPPSTWRSVKHGLSYLIPPIPTTMSLPDILFNSPEATIAERGSTLARSSRADLADSLMKSMKEDVSPTEVERRASTVGRKRVAGSGGGWSGGLSSINWSSGLSAIGVGGTSASTSDKVEPPSKSPTLPTPPPISPFTAEFPSSTLHAPAIDSVATWTSQPESTVSSATLLAESPALTPDATAETQVELTQDTLFSVKPQGTPLERFDKTVQIYLGREGALNSKACLRILFNGDLTFASIGRSDSSEALDDPASSDRPEIATKLDSDGLETQQWLLKKSNRLLEAVVAILEISDDATTKKDEPPYPHRYAARTGLFTDQTNSTSPSASSPTPHSTSSSRSVSSTNKLPTSTKAVAANDSSSKENDEDVEIHNALVTAVTSMRSNPHILESCTRTNSSHWVLSRKLDGLVHATPSISTEVYLVLPPKIGKEGSIIDAEEEMRVLERRLRSHVGL